ncbi:hypothetical protein HNQ91_004814 [Filimonas zeae]|nr:DUF4397 domain-containing protein [Filimonas zeae]MDR6341741.1 hypothetical protein [Filimonas zeae]
MKKQFLHVSRKMTWAVALMGISSFGFISCSSDDDPVVQPDSQVKVIHAVPTGGSVDFYLNGTKQNSSAVAYGEQTGYIATSNGDKTAEFKTSVDNNTILSAPVSFDGGNYTLFATGQAGNNSLTTLLVEDNLQTPGNGKVRVRFVHVAPDAPTVNVVANDSTWATGRTYKSATDFVEVNAGSYVFKLNRSDNGTTAYTSQSIALTSGKNYTLVARGLTSGAGAVVAPLTLQAYEY